MAQRGGKRPGAGRPKGALSKSTQKAHELRSKFVDMVHKEYVPIFQALINEAKKGDVPAIKEIHDRTWGKAPQDLDVKTGGEKIVFTLPAEILSKNKLDE